jgi:hypothetical protein
MADLPFPFSHHQFVIKRFQIDGATIFYVNYSRRICSPFRLVRKALPIVLFA